MHRHRKNFPVLILALLVAVGCARNPVTGDRQLALISEEQEIAMGREAHPHILQEFGRVDDAGLQGYTDSIGQRLAGLSHRPDLEWHFTVVDVPVVNAFAVPGGYIYFTREIMAYMNNEAEFAGVMSHEIGHVTARHSVSQISKAQLFSLGLGLGSIFSPTFRQLGEVAQMGVSVLFLKYSRDAEEQSDQLGIEYMSEAGYDPRELSDFFTVFQRMQEESGQALPSWLSSHPAPPDRIEDTSAMAQQVVQQNPNQNWIDGRQRFLQQLEGIVFGNNPREGFMADGTFLHPELRFQMRFPNGWNVQNTRSSVQAVNPNQDAAIQLTLADAPSGTSPDQYAASIANMSGVRLVDGRRATVNGNPAFLGVYDLQNPNGFIVRALAAFVSYRGSLYQLVGMSERGNFSRYQNTLEASLTSFSELNDPAALNVQPDRIQIVTARGSDTLARIADRINNPRVQGNEIALLNRIDPNEPLSSGTLVKVVVPGRR